LCILIFWVRRIKDVEECLEFIRDEIQDAVEKAVPKGKTKKNAKKK
jgi:hypothetical protein